MIATIKLSISHCYTFIGQPTIYELPYNCSDMNIHVINVIFIAMSDMNCYALVNLHELCPINDQCCFVPCDHHAGWYSVILPQES